MGRLKVEKSLENAARPKDSSLPFSTRGMDKQPAPADSRGIVIPERAIEKIKAQYPSGVSFVQPGDYYSVHEFYWPKNLYTHKVAKEFRLLPPNRGILPRSFHTILHELTSDQPPPSIDIMQGYCESWAVGRGLLRAANTCHGHTQKKIQMLRLLQDHYRQGEVDAEIIAETMEMFTKNEQESLRYFSAMALKVHQAPSLTDGFNFQGLSGAAPHEVRRNMARVAFRSKARDLRPLFAGAA